MGAFTKCHFLKSLSAVVSTGLFLCHHSASFYPWSDIFGTTKVSDRSSETSAFQTIVHPKMIWTFGTMSECVTMKSEIGHWIYKQAKHSCWKWSIKPYAWLIFSSFLTYVFLEQAATISLHHCSLPTNGSGRQWEKTTKHSSEEELKQHKHRTHLRYYIKPYRPTGLLSRFLLINTNNMHHSFNTFVKSPFVKLWGKRTKPNPIYTILAQYACCCNLLPVNVTSL